MSQRAAFITLPLCLIGGFWATYHWFSTGNLTPYAVMQFGGLTWIAIAYFFGKANPQEDFPWGSLLLFYGLAKAAEYFDAGLFELTHHLFSGHSLKHVLAAFVVVSFSYAIRYKQKTSLSIEASAAPVSLA